MLKELTTMSKQIRAELCKFQLEYRNLLYSRPTDPEVDKREQQMIAALREQMEDELSYCRDIEECNKAMRDYHATSFTTVQVVTECEMESQVAEADFAEDVYNGTYVTAKICTSYGKKQVCLVCFANRP